MQFLTSFHFWKECILHVWLLRGDQLKNISGIFYVTQFLNYTIIRQQNQRNFSSIQTHFSLWSHAFDLIFSICVITHMWYKNNNMVIYNHILVQNKTYKKQISISTHTKKIFYLLKTLKAFYNFRKKVKPQEKRHRLQGHTCSSHVQWESICKRKWPLIVILTFISL